MSNVVRFPTPLKMEQFFTEEAIKAEIRQGLGFIVGTLHGKPTRDDFLNAFTALSEAKAKLQDLYLSQEGAL